MRPHNRTIDEEVLGHVTAVALQTLPELPPDTAGFPAAKLPWHISPGNTSAGHIEDRLDEQPVTQFRWTAGLVFDGGESRFDLRPRGIGEEQAYGHQCFPPSREYGGKRKPRP
jgi:hypothetical protein